MQPSNLTTQEIAHAPNSRPKTAYLEMDRLTSEPCDMEFRPETNFSAVALVGAIAKCLAVAIAIPVPATILTCVQLDSLLQLPLILVAAIPFLAIMMVRSAYDPHPIPTYGGRVLRWAGQLVRRYALVCVLGIVLYRIWPAAGFINSLRLYIIVSAVMIMILADSIATHAVYWMTASPLADMCVLRSWRDDWCRRFFSQAKYSLALSEDTHVEQHRYEAALAARSVYALGFVWVAAALTFPVVVVLCTHDGSSLPSLRLNIMASVTLSLVLTALVRCGGRFTAVGRLTVHWLEYLLPAECPPWVFRSPCGYRADRQILLYATVAVLSILALQVLGGTTSATGVSESVAFHSSALARAVATATWSAAFCVVQIAAAVAIVIGPVVNTFYDLFERN